MRVGTVVFVVWVLAACGGDDEGPPDPRAPECAPVGDYFCSCSKVVDTCGAAYIGMPSNPAKVERDDEVCQGSARDEDSGWVAAIPGDPQTCYIRRWDTDWWNSWEQVVESWRRVKVTCPGVPACSLAVSCTCK